MADAVSHLAILLNEHPKIHSLAEIRVLFENVCHIERGANEGAALERLDKRGALEAVEYLSYSFYSLYRVELSNVGVNSHIFISKFNVRSNAGHTEIILKLIVSCLAFSVKFKLENVLSIVTGHQGLDSLIKEVLYFFEKRVDKSVLVGIKAFFLDDIEHSLRSNLVALDHRDHIRMLREVADRLGADGSYHFDRNYLLLVLYVSTGCTDDIIERHDAVLYHLYPREIHVSFNEFLIERNIAASALDRIYEILVELVGVELTQKILGKLVVNLFNFSFFDIRHGELTSNLKVFLN